MNKAGVVDTERTDRIKRLVSEDGHNSSVFEPGYSKCKCMDLEDIGEDIDDVDELKVLV